MAKNRPRDKKTGKFLTKRQISARKAARKSGKKRSKKKRSANPKRRKPRRKPMAKKKRRRRRSGGGAGKMSNKQKQEVCIASAALGYIEENTELTENLPMYKPDAAGKAAKPVKRHLVYGLLGHFASQSMGGGDMAKWMDRSAAALLIVGSFEAGQSKFTLEGGGSKSLEGKGDGNPYNEVEVSGDIDDDG